MNARRTLHGLPLALAAGLAAPALMAQTTGTLVGKVTDPRGRPVAGAVVTIQGANIQGVRTSVADKQGRYRFNLISPGPCRITATAKGFAKEEVASTQVKAEIDDMETLLNMTVQAATQIALDQVTTRDLVLKPLGEATVEVVAETQNVVDVKAAAVGQNFTSDSFLNLPTSRDFANIANLTPGVTEDREGFKVYGGTGAENNYVVDGINTTNVEFGKQGKKIPVEFIQEFQVKTGGYDAEYGKATGGIVNVITKSGGNEFTGDVFYYYESKGLQASNTHANEGFKPAPLGFRNVDFGFDLGGYFIKDKLWFLIAFDRSDRSSTDKILTGVTAGSSASNKSTRDLFAGKLTWRINENQSLVASFLGDPEELTGAVKPALGPEATYTGISKTGGTDYSLRYEISGADWFGQAQLSRHQETNSTLPSGAGANVVQLTDQTLGGAVTGGFGRFDEKAFTRDNFAASFSKIFGAHELKVGFDLQDDAADTRRGFSGGQSVIKYDNPATPGSNPIYVHTWWTTPFATLPSAPSITFTSKPKHESKAYFLQDKWTVNSGLTLNLGIRLDETTVIDPQGITRLTLKNQWAPRLGLVWDWKGKGQDKVYASLCRFYEQVPMDLVIRSFSAERNPAVINYDPASFTPNSAAEADYGDVSSIIGGYNEPVDDKLKGQYSDEFILGVETTVKERYTVGVKFIRRYLGRVIEDGYAASTGDYFIMNPGVSGPNGITYPKATRDFHGLEFTLQRKLADHFTWQASYLWSELRGNYEGAFQGIGGADGTGQLDPNINSAFDLQEFVVNSHGQLSGDRKHQLKANGYYEWSNGLSMGASFQYLSGTPISRLGFANDVDYDRYEYFLVQRGTEGRTPGTSRLDVNVAYPLKLKNKHQIRFMLDITNLLDSQTATVIDQRYNFAATDVGQTNPNYRKGAAFQSPRSIRIGIRYSF